MSGINFLHKDETDKKRAESVRGIVVPITTAVLVVYLVTLSAILGWWAWWSSKQEVVSTELITLRGQVNSKQQSEVLAKRMIDRVNVINNYLGGRKDIYANSDFLIDKPFVVANFGLTKEGYYYVEITSPDPSNVTALEADLKLRYTDVMVDKLIWSEQLWSATYWYKGDKT